MVSSVPPLSLEQIYPETIGPINLNTCGDPDCGACGGAPDACHADFRGRGAEQRRMLSSISIPALATGLGRYKLSSPSEKALERVSTALEYDGDPTAWTDGRVLVRQHQRGNAKCEIQHQLLSNEHFEAEAARLRSQNGILEGPACGACGRAYREAPGEFVFNGANGKTEGKKGEKSVKRRALGVRMIHKPCRGEKGARFTVSAEHRGQKDRSDNLQILSQLVNGAGINDIRRLLFPAKGCSETGIKRVYDRIFWLERTLLAYEHAQLGAWRKRLAAADRFRHTRIAHDDVVLGINWETASDRRITALNCSVSADIQSGCIFRIDVDFDPTVEPVRFVEEHYLGGASRTPALRGAYRQTDDGHLFTAPLLAFQRPSGRFDESALFASARSHLGLFVDKTQEALSRSANTISPAVQSEISDARVKEAVLRIVADDYFNLPVSERDGRNAFAGVMTRDTYTKAAHLACLKDMAPYGKITLVSEQEAAMARVVPHVYRDEILEDRFEWRVVAFDKKATKPTILRRTSAFKNAFDTFMQARPDLEPSRALEQWTEQRLTPRIQDRSQGRGPSVPNIELRVEVVALAVAPQPCPCRRRNRKGRGVPDPLSAIPRRTIGIFGCNPRFSRKPTRRYAPRSPAALSPRHCNP